MATMSRLLTGFSEETMLPAGLMAEYWETVGGIESGVPQKKDVDVKSIFELPDNGGARAKDKIEKGQLVGEYTGVIVKAQLYEKLYERESTEERVERRINALDFDEEGKFVVLAWEPGNWTRCVAQSCQPNLKGVIGVGKDEVPVIQVVTTRDIQPGEVLSFDYVGQNCNKKLKLECDCELHAGLNAEDSRESSGSGGAGSILDPIENAGNIDDKDVDAPLSGRVETAQEGDISGIEAGTSRRAGRRSERLTRLAVNPILSSKHDVTGQASEGGVKVSGKKDHTVRQHAQKKKERNGRETSQAGSASTTGGRFVCRLCGSQHRSARDLGAHHKKRHAVLDDGKFVSKCERCGLIFTRPAHLWRHMLVHTQAAPFACGKCGISYRRKDTLGRHMRKKHAEEAG